MDSNFHSTLSQFLASTGGSNFDAKPGSVLAANQQISFERDLYPGKAFSRSSIDLRVKCRLCSQYSDHAGVVEHSSPALEVRRSHSQSHDFRGGPCFHVAAPQYLNGSNRQSV